MDMTPPPDRDRRLVEALRLAAPYHEPTSLSPNNGVVAKTGLVWKERDFTAIVVDQTHHGPCADERRPLLPRKAADPDVALVERLRRSDAGAAEALVSAYGNRLYRLALRMTGNAADAEEVAQDALWAASRKIHTFRGAVAFGTWVYRITANGAYQKLRGRRGQRNEVSWEDLAPAFDGEGQHVEVAGDWSRRLKDPAIEAELKSVLSAAIDELPLDYRTAFVLHDVEGLANPEIAQTLQVRLATIKSRVHRARLFLRRRLEVYVGARPRAGFASRHPGQGSRS
jgi:RNA polymerase sigma-70 factor (ECF subfamily)